jgi:hypothetical protein
VSYTGSASSLPGSSKQSDVCLLATGPGSSGGTLGEQQNFRQLPAANTTNALSCGFLAQPSQLEEANAQVGRFRLVRIE